MNGGSRLENLIRGGNQQSVDQEQNGQAAESPSTTSLQSQSQQTGQGTALGVKNSNMSTGINSTVFVGILVFSLIIAAVIFVVVRILKQKRKAKEFERALKMIPMLIHLPPSTDDIQGGGRDERDVNDEAISQATIMYTIISSTLKKSGMKTHVYGQKYFSFEIVAVDGFVKYYAVVPAVLTETVKQAILTSYPTARLEETEVENIFSRDGMDDSGGTEDQYNAENFVAGGELVMKKEVEYPILTFQEMKWDAQLALLNAFSKVRIGEGLGLQVMFRPLDSGWSKNAETKIKNIKSGKKGFGSKGSNLPTRVLYLLTDLIRAPFEVPDEHKKDKDEQNPELSQRKQEEIQAIDVKAKFPAFECLIRIVAHSKSKARSEGLVGGVVAAFSQFDSPNSNGFKYDLSKKVDQLVTDYIFRFFPVSNKKIVLNTQELATIFHLPSQASIPSSGVERQMTKQVDGPASLITDGVLIGRNEYRGAVKEIRLSVNDRRRHMYVIGASGMGKSVFLKNIAYQDMVEGKGFCFIDPHGDVTEELLSMVPEDRIDDVIYFDPSDMEFPIGMNMLEAKTPEEKDFIVQEGINMLYSLYDPGHTGIFGPRGEQMFRNAALLLMSDPKGATFLDIPSPFINKDLVVDKLKYVTDRDLFDYWTKEFPASQKSNDAGEVITWFASKWSPFKQNTMMKRVLGQIKSGFNIREIMDQQKILLVNLSKGKLGELNSKLLGMIFVMKFQTAAMSRVDTPEHDRKDFCLFVDEFQNFSTESFESILSEARKFRLNLIVANQFMTQLTDKIREGVLGNVGTIVAGRVGVTDAEMLEKVFTPVFKAEDLHKQPNHHAITTVLMNGMPSAPFTMNLPAPMGKEDRKVFESLREYSAKKYGRPGAEVDKEIDERLNIKNEADKPAKEAPSGEGGGFMSMIGGKNGGQGIDLGMAKVPVSQAIPGSPEAAKIIQQANEAPAKELSLEEIDAELAKLSQESKSNDLDWLSTGESEKQSEKQEKIAKNTMIEPKKRDSGQMSSGDVINLR
jgi:Type IV secretory pathway, VirD4 components